MSQSNVFGYPRKGQSKEQQAKDELECYKWAKEQSGVDPGVAPAGPDRGKRMGGTAGGVRGRRGAVEAEKESAAAQGGSHDRAFGVCMEGRGYSVK